MRGSSSRNAAASLSGRLSSPRRRSMSSSRLAFSSFSLLASSNGASGTSAVTSAMSHLHTAHVEDRLQGPGLRAQLEAELLEQGVDPAEQLADLVGIVVEPRHRIGLVAT